MSIQLIELPLRGHHRLLEPLEESFVSIHMPRAGRDQCYLLGDFLVYVSIHAPRAGRDQGAAHHAHGFRRFNPRAPCGARPWCVLYRSVQRWFQSTRPVWGATSPVFSHVSLMLFQSTRPVWGATVHGSASSTVSLFQSTRPVWGATMPRCPLASNN